MSLQVRILEQYRQVFPRHTLREISHQTGIQLTRVFRLMNGSPMKLDEYENFRRVIEKDERVDLDHNAFNRCIGKARETFSEVELTKLTALIERHLQWHQLIHGSSRSVSQEQMA